MIELFLDYMQSLCEKHTAFQHTPDKIAYYEFDWVGMMAAGRKRNDQILYIHKIKGVYDDNRGDNRTDTTSLIFLIVKKVPQRAMHQARTNMLQCKAYAEEFKEKMRYDAANGSPELCQLLRRADLDSWTYEQTELQSDGWIGIQIRLNFKQEYTTQYDPKLWQ